MNPTPPPDSPFQLSAASRAPLSVLVSRQLRDAILSGAVASGTELPSEHELAERFEVGRSTVREAVRILQAQGLLSGGDRVTTRRPRVSGEEDLNAAAGQVLENALRLGQIPIADLVELRVLLEGASVEAAALGPEAALGEARAALDDMAESDGTLDRFLAADLRFHHGLALASGNAALPLIMGVLRQAIASHLSAALAQRPDPGACVAQLHREHAAIYQAVAAGEGSAAAALVSHHIRDFYRARVRP